jgi:polyisoprenoid-binding protein YceI
VPAALALSTPSPALASGPVAPIDPSGQWSVASGSQAGYRIGEVLSGNQVEVVGRTDQVTGSATIEGGQLTAARVAVRTATLATDESARDADVRRALNTSAYPEATFELTEPVSVADIGTATGAVDISAPGTLTIGHTTVDVVASLHVQRTADGLEVAGDLPVALADLGLPTPDPGFVTVDPTASVEFLVLLTR